jgi:Zn-finger protein
MHPLAYNHLKKILEAKNIVGPDETCDYYPCHFAGQDCTWCFWVHKPEVAKALMEEFKKHGIDSVDDIEKRKNDMNKIFAILKDEYPPNK